MLNHVLNMFKMFYELGPQNERQMAVVKALKYSWSGYKKYAWGHDNIKPISKGYHEWFGLGLTIVDSLDTLYMMGLNEGMFYCFITQVLIVM